MSPRTPSERIPVAVLGATGAVGQMFIRLLADHPWFQLAEVAASERSAGRRYADAAHWIGADQVPATVRDMTVRACDPAAVSAPLVFSALDASVARDVEAAFARAGRLVLSNAKSFRMDDDVPLVIPEVNADHLALLDVQRRKRGWTGAIVTNANCSSIVAVMALAPLHRAFGITRMFVSTMQAVSGAGYPGVASLDILGNVIPFIKDEEGKIQTEILKMLGTLDGDRVVPAATRISAHANRVPVENGHTICMSLDFERTVTPDEAIAVMRDWTGDESCRALPTAPARALVVTDEPDRPQPRRDADRGGGMTVTVGRVREDPLFSIKLVASGHNTVRGAAGASVLNAELLVASGRAGVA
ncbi:MAG TPA: aspartate-semialdehyde dehydrogenase [Gemmatimonadaceae bacterium]|nr:aspartate-semialdehyde dehydrogenase [Gemmatimonadaceae bacterium]